MFHMDFRLWQPSVVACGASDHANLKRRRRLWSLSIKWTCRGFRNRLSSVCGPKRSPFEVDFSGVSHRLKLQSRRFRPCAVMASSASQRLTSNASVSLCPARAAKCSAVCWFRSFAASGAFASSSSCSAWPSRVAARCSAMTPWLSVRVTSARCRSSARVASAVVALCSGAVGRSSLPLRCKHRCARVAASQGIRGHEGPDPAPHDVSAAGRHEPFGAPLAPKSR